MAITMDGIFVNGQKATFRPEDILSGDASAYTEEIGTAVEAWMEQNVTGGEQVTDTTLTLPGVPADAKKTGDEISSLKEELTTISDGNHDCMLHAKFYDGYYNGTPAYTGTKTEGKTAGWGICVIPVPLGKQITLSGFRAQGGVNCCWLNSSDPADVNQIAWTSAYNSGTKTCVTAWLGISDYNYKGLTDDPKVNYAVINDINAEIASNKEEFDIFVNANDRDSCIITDNYFSDRLSDWSQGLYPSGGAVYASHINEKFDVQDGILYIVSDVDTGYTSHKIMIYVFDENDTFLVSYDYAVNAARQINIKNLQPTASYFYVAVNSTNSSVPVSPKDCVAHFKAYVGYSNIEDMDNYYPTYISNYAEKLYKDELYVKDGETGSYSTSYNYYSNNPDDWIYPAYNATLKENIIPFKTNCPLMTMHDPSSVPAHLSNGALVIKQYDSSANVLATHTHYLASGNRTVWYFQIDDDCAYIIMSFNTGDANIKVDADDIRSLKMYAGKALFTSYSVFPDYEFPAKTIPNQARTLMDGGYLPDYWLDYLNEKKDTLDDLNETIGNHGFSFAFITDEHWPANYQKSPYIMKWLKDHTVISRFVSGGDLLNEHASIDNAMRYMRNWRDNLLSIKMRNIRGNHDNNSMQSNTSAYIGDGRFYANMIRPIENDVAVEDGQLFYYEKIDAQKVYIFYLDTGDMINASLIDFDAQIAWMGDIVETLDSDWSILVIQHIIYDGGTSESPTLYSTGTKTIDFLNSVTNCNVIGLIGGHTHYDYSDTSNGWPIIITSTDSSQREQTLPATEGTVSEQLFDAFHVDTENRKIYATRIGAGTDREWSY